MGTAAVSASWADVLGEGRLPRFVLICLAVWLNAADSLVTATIMPSIGRALGGYVYFGWATAGYLMGLVLAGASSGVVTLRFGLRSATMAAALLYAGGCVLSATVPEIFTFLAGRMLQGIGGGWQAGISSVAIGLLFANCLLPWVYASISSVWGVAVLKGPLLDGLFNDAGSWRDVFWLRPAAQRETPKPRRFAPRTQRNRGRSRRDWRPPRPWPNPLAAAVALACLSAWRIAAPPAVRAVGSS
jgi:MFS family permease